MLSYPVSFGPVKYTNYKGIHQVYEKRQSFKLEGEDRFPHKR